MLLRYFEGEDDFAFSDSFAVVGFCGLQVTSCEWGRGLKMKPEAEMKKTWLPAKCTDVHFVDRKWSS